MRAISFSIRQFRHQFKNNKLNLLDQDIRGIQEFPAKEFFIPMIDLITQTSPINKINYYYYYGVDYLIDELLVEDKKLRKTSNNFKVSARKILSLFDLKVGHLKSKKLGEIVILNNVYTHIISYGGLLVLGSRLIGVLCYKNIYNRSVNDICEEDYINSSELEWILDYTAILFLGNQVYKLFNYLASVGVTVQVLNFYNAFNVVSMLPNSELALTQNVLDPTKITSLLDEVNESNKVKFKNALESLYPDIVYAPEIPEERISESIPVVSTEEEEEEYLEEDDLYMDDYPDSVLADQEDDFPF